MFARLLTSIVSTSNHRKYVSLSSLKCVIQPTLINLHLSEYSKELNYYTSAVKLDRCIAIPLMTCLIKCVFQTKQTI